MRVGSQNLFQRRPWRPEEEGREKIRVFIPGYDLKRSEVRREGSRKKMGTWKGGFRVSTEGVVILDEVALSGSRGS